MKFRKKPVVIEAFQLPPKCGLQGGSEPPPVWLVSAILDGYVEADLGKDHAIIRTLEGDMRCDVGDWIIRGVKGELYPCKPDIFAATYEPAT
jgi:hypothetical protein